MSTFLIFFAFVALVAAGEEPLQPQELDHHHVTTVCIQVHGKSPLCGPMVNPEAQPNLRGSESQFDGPTEFRPQMATDEAYLEGYYKGTPIFRMRSAAEKSQGQVLKKPQEPCDPSSRSAGSVTVVQPGNPYGLTNPALGGLGAYSQIGATPNVVIQQQPLPGLYRSAPAPPPAARTIPFAPFGVEQRFQGQKMRAEKFIQNMRAASDCDDNLPPPPMQMRSNAFLRQQQMLRQQDYMPPSQNYVPMRESQSAESLAKQCAEQELEIKKKTDEIAVLQKQIERLTEKATVESKTIAVKEASKEKSADSNFKDAQVLIKKK